MNQAEIQDAVAAFLEAGGKVQEVGQAPATGKPAEKDYSHIAEALRGYRFITEAARDLGLSTRTINHVAKQFGIRFESRNSISARAERARLGREISPEIRRAPRSEGRTALAARLGIPVGTLRHIAKEQGIELKGKRGPKPKQEATE